MSQKVTAAPVPSTARTQLLPPILSGTPLRTLSATILTLNVAGDTILPGAIPETLIKPYTITDGDLKVTASGSSATKDPNDS